MNTTFLGIDMGGTGSRFALVDRDGTLIVRGVAGGGTGNLFSDAARSEFHEAIAEIATACRPHAITATVAGITGLGAPVEPTARGILADVLDLPVDAIGLFNDAELAYHAAFSPGEGHLIAAGTGTIGLHVAPDGTSTRVGGRGPLIDDAGSGSWLALRALEAVFRDIDRNGRPTETAILARHLFAAIDGYDWDTVRGYVYGNGRGKLGELAVAVSAAESEGDPIAADLMKRAGDELALLANALRARCGRLPIHVTGRVPSLSPVLRDTFRQALGDVQIRFEAIDVALAAAQLAVKNFGGRAR
ncbi:N-acetylglucosamine kinase [Pararhizobium mangrovi]|uniref:N-acetylglucosamine kinase n=1 Tax=Pararhizobium mangrovi TaxID=2590452 RepID=A0A506TYD2_9HYPH|nr:BadF/BadG/BcrA/BcrD ATPase family protein [Pararhizobium mangrovi]TPW26326.1 N-acetylglucosamine kinase [Pararhizobium mangrovi]